MTETQKEREGRIQSSSQTQNGRFVNPNGISAKLFSKETWDLTKEYIFVKRIDPKPTTDLPMHRLHPEQWENDQAGQFSFSWLGHASVRTRGRLLVVIPAILTVSKILVNVWGLLI